MNLQDLDKKKLAQELCKFFLHKKKACTRIVQEFCHWQKLAEFLCKFCKILLFYFILFQNKVTGKNMQNSHACLVESCYFILFYFIANGCEPLKYHK